MTRPRRGVTLIVHRDGDVESRTYRFPQWAIRSAAVAGITIASLILLGAALYGPIVRTAARVPGLNREIARLTDENQQVHALRRTLDIAEARYAQVRGMLGGNVVPAPAGPARPTAVAEGIYARPPVGGRSYEAGPSAPRHWPLDEPGVVTRGEVGAGQTDEKHAGLDIAVPMGTLIRASGGGRIAAAGDDTEYGLFVLIEHPDGYQTMYGHASRLLVAAGQKISAGEVIGLAGSTGRSTAPHLHFEIRRDGRSLDPRSVVKED